MSLMSYGFTKGNVNNSLADDECEVVFEKRVDAGMMSPVDKKERNINSNKTTPKSATKSYSNAIKGVNKVNPKSPNSPLIQRNLTSNKPKPANTHKSAPKAKNETTVKSPKANSSGSSKSSPKKLKTGAGSPLKFVPIKPKPFGSSKNIAKPNPQAQDLSLENLDVSPTSKKNAPDNFLPYHRVKLIMKSCPDVEAVPQESLHLITKATELFIKNLTTNSVRLSHNNILNYENLSSLVHSKSSLEFLKETIPKKITWAQAQEIMAAKKRTKNN